jgi:hypothetical protein
VNDTIKNKLKYKSILWYFGKSSAKSLLKLLTYILKYEISNELNNMLNLSFNEFVNFFSDEVIKRKSQIYEIEKEIKNNSEKFYKDYS